MPQDNGLVKAQYTNYAYPEPIADISDWINSGNYQCGDPSRIDALIWPEGRKRENLKILIAGCGTYQAAVYAYNNPDSKVVGIDISEESLKHQAYLKTRHNLANLELVPLDLLAASSLNEKFDLIISTGVLHHLPDPEAGLKSLASVLAPDGRIFLMLYGKSRRIGVYLLQDIFRRLAVPQTKEGIDFVKEVIGALPKHHYANHYIREASDLLTDAGLVDTFLHPQDKAYSVSEIFDLINSVPQLRFQSWMDNSAYFPEYSIPESSALYKRIIDLPWRDQWQVVDNINLYSGCHFFIVRNENDSNEFIQDEMDLVNLERYIPVRHIALNYLGKVTQKNAEMHGYKRENAHFHVSDAEHIVISMMNGSRNIFSLMKDDCFSKFEQEIVRNFIIRLVVLLWKMGHIYLKS